MKVTFTKLSDQRHAVLVERGDGTSESVELDGDDMALAETISGPMQTMMRADAEPGEIREVLGRVAPALASVQLAERLHTRIRSLRGQWAATPYGGQMLVTWPEKPDR